MSMLWQLYASTVGASRRLDDRKKRCLPQRACLGNRGADVDADGQAAIIAQRLHQLIRQNGKIVDFEIYFPDREYRLTHSLSAKGADR